MGIIPRPLTGPSNGYCCACNGVSTPPPPPCAAAAAAASRSLARPPTHSFSFTSYGIIGETLTNSILGKTFFAHFCAGETADQVGARAGTLQALGVGGILDYAAEVDLRPAPERAEREAKKRAAGDNRLLLEVCAGEMVLS